MISLLHIAHKYSRDIRYWIFLFFLIRLIGITYPPFEVGHNWRQTTGTMVARNFYEINANPYYPRVDFGGDLTGITAMEFPLLNELIYGVSLIFGYDHWYGRLINLLLTSIGLVYFYKLLKLLFDEPLAFLSTLLLTCSIWFQFGRKIMPDTLAVSLLLISLYHAVVFLGHSTIQWWRIAWSAFLFMLGALGKLPAVLPYFAFPLLYLVYRRPRRWAILIGYFALALIPIVHWYFVWTDHLTITYGLHHFFLGKSISTGAQEVYTHLGLTCSRILVGPLKYIGGLVFLAGVGLVFYRRLPGLIGLLLTTTIGLVLLILKSGETFYAHDYYIIPFVPVIVILTAYVLLQLPPKWTSFCAIAICIESLLNQSHDFRLKPQYNALVELESIMDRYTQPNERIAINCAPNPSTIYFAHRKGWICSNAELGDSSYIEQLRNSGLHFVLICKNRFGQDMQLLPYVQVFENMHYRIYDITKTESSFGIALCP
jgi:Dolichyl-phosphate-mannose-protein mannosyltransferase